MTKKSQKKRRIPALCKNGEYAFVTWRGRRTHLGRYGTPEAEQAYRQWVHEWTANGFEAPIPEAQGEGVTVCVLCLHYAKYAETYYRRGGVPTSTLQLVNHVIRILNRWYADLPATSFGPIKLKELQNILISGEHVPPDKKPRPLARETINKMIFLIRSIFKYGASLELLPITVYQSLCSLAQLKADRSQALETPAVVPAPDTHIEAVLSTLPSPLKALVKLQLLTAARPSELLKLRPCDFDRNAEVWKVTLTIHKTAHKGRSRVLYFGPQAQSVLAPFLLRDSKQYLFRPIEAMRERWSGCETHRRPDQKPNAKKTDRVVNDHYTASSYRIAIHRACVDAKVPAWNPYQLRHNAATRIDKTCDEEAAKIILGHASSETTKIYIDRDDAKALEVITKIG